MKNSLCSSRLDRSTTTGGQRDQKRSGYENNDEEDYGHEWGNAYRDRRARAGANFASGARDAFPGDVWEDDGFGQFD